MDFLKSIGIVLVSPQNPENIGLTARIMKNMDFQDLILVNPPDLRKAFEVSKRARDILEKAKIYSCLKEALEPFNFVIASTRRKRKDILVSSLKQTLHTVFSLALGSKTAVLFGREDFGLSRSDLEFADMVFTIPASSGFGSLNVSFAAGIFCYELFCLAKDIRQVPALKYASKKDTDKFYEYFDGVLSHIGYNNNGRNPSKNITGSVRRIFKRTRLTKREAEMLKGISLKLKMRLEK